MRDDQFSQSLEVLDNGCLPDSAVDAEDVLLMLAQHYAYVFPSDSTLAMLAGLGPLVEIGARHGILGTQAALDRHGYCRLRPGAPRRGAYQQVHSRTRPWTHVEQGDQTVLSGYADRGLFLCWPPLFSSLGDCLTYYCGDTVAYIGDGGLSHRQAGTACTKSSRRLPRPVRALDPTRGPAPAHDLETNARMNVINSVGPRPAE